MAETIATLGPAFRDRRVFERFERLVFGHLTAEDRRTITAMLEASGRTDCDWSADYRVFSRDVWEPADVFGLLVPQILSLAPTRDRAIVAALDDTNLRKCGSQIPGVAYRRDPMSPPFHVNFVRAQRFLQTSIVVPFAAQPSAARAIPVAFDHAPSAAKLPKNPSDDQRRQHREQRQAMRLTVRGIDAIQHLRAVIDQTDPDRRLLMTVDGSYTNGEVLKELPANTDVIGRIRKDARLHHLPERSIEPGRPRSYGSELTPEQVRQDQAVPWTSVKIFAAGRLHDCDVKLVEPLLWRKSGASLRLRLIVIRPLAYRRSKNSDHLLYRQPAYLITTDLVTPVGELVQAYFWRWDIEVNHRDEKQLIGVGQAQVRAARSAERVPAFGVACYAILLIAAAKTFGLASTDPIVALPKWRTQCSRSQRISTRQMQRRLRAERLVSAYSRPNFDHFASNVASHLKLPKSALCLQDALKYACS